MGCLFSPCLFSKCFKQDVKQSFYLKIMLLAVEELQIGRIKKPRWFIKNAFSSFHGLNFSRTSVWKLGIK